MKPVIDFRRNAIALLLFAHCATYIGCGEGSDFAMAPVSGKVTLDGKPLAEAHVGFEPIAQQGTSVAGPGSYATTDKEGHFELKSLDNHNGAVVGSHHVTIRTLQAERGPNGEVKVIQQEILPNRYHAETELTFTVPQSGTEAADFDLESN